MTILQINTVCEYGSTGCLVTDIAVAVEHLGHNCSIAYGQRHSASLHSFKIGSIFENHLHNLCSRLFGKQGYYTQNGTNALIQYIQELRPDIIHLHNLHGNYLNLPLLFDYLYASQFPVVITLHDCWAFTGKCTHYSAVNCFKWKTECNKCPQYKSYPPSLFLDHSKKLYADKKHWFTRLNNLHVVAVSKWLEREVQQSFLSKHPIHQIYNWVDCYKFSRVPKDKRDFLFDKYQLQRQYKYLLSVSSDWSINTNKIADAILLARKLPEDYKLILVGNLGHFTQLPNNIIHIPYTTDISELAAIYSLAFCYVHLSVEDTFGIVISEAMACGTIPVVYNSTACPEIVNSLGFVVEPHDIEAIIRILPTLASPPEVRTKLVNYVKTHYNQNINVQKYIDIYTQIISGPESVKSETVIKNQLI